MNFPKLAAQFAYTLIELARWGKKGRQTGSETTHYVAK